MRVCFTRMSRLAISLFRPGLFLVACLAFALARPGLADRPSPQELTSKIDEYMAARVERYHFNGTILLAQNGSILFCRGYGMANLEHDIPCTATTKFRLGSITKQFTAMAVLILQERGKLSVTDKVKKYLPSAPKAWDDITIHHLLTHTAGIPNYTSFPDFMKTIRNQVTLDELIAKFKDKPLEFKPGEKFKYSNSGYIVLGKIIEIASGQPYATFMKEAIFDPLEMHDTGYDTAAAVLKNRASGYTRLLGVAPANASYIDMSLPHAAGALYSTVVDLLKWDRAWTAISFFPKSRSRRCLLLSRTITLMAGRSTPNSTSPGKCTVAGSPGLSRSSSVSRRQIRRRRTQQLRDFARRQDRQ